MASQATLELTAIGLWLWDRRSCTMRVHDDVPGCIVFLGLTNERGQFIPYGTGFCVLIAERTLGYPYVVTALHVIDQIPGDVVSMRIKHHNEGFRSLAVEKSFFFGHPAHDPSKQYIDVAAAYLNDTQPNDPITWVREEEFATDAEIDLHNIGIGDEVVVPGLLLNHIGETRNIPVVRTGNIAAMRAEPVPTDFGFMDAYLVEIRSINGLSGSPAFLHMGVRPPLLKKAPLGSTKTHYLLGLMHGYYIVNGTSGEGSTGDPPKVRTTSSPPMTGDMNTGIAIAVPAQRILETLYRQEIKEGRNRHADEFFSKAGARPA